MHRRSGISGAGKLCEKEIYKKIQKNDSWIVLDILFGPKQKCAGKLALNDSSLTKFSSKNFINLYVHKTNDKKAL